MKKRKKTVRVTSGSKPAARTRRAAVVASAEPSRSAQLDAELGLLRAEFSFYREKLENEQHQQSEARRELELSTRLYADLFDSAPIAYVLLDRNGFIRDANLAAAQVFGISRRELCGKPIIHFALKTDRRKLQAHLHRCRNSTHPEQVATELELAAGDGRTLSVQLCSVPEAGVSRASKATRLYRTAVLDITDRKHAETTLCRLNAMLEGHVVERSAELDQAVKRLQEEMAVRARAEQLLRQSSDELQVRMNQLRRLAHELVRTEQRERRRLAQVLHDHLQQLLVGARLQAELLRKKNFPALAPAELVKVSGLLDESHNICRMLTVDLCPPVLHDSGLHEALRWLGHWMEENHGLKVNLSLHTELPPDKEGLSAFLFQAVRELLFNVQKHAGVKTAAVTLARNNGYVRIVVADEGAGFDPPKNLAARSDGGFGLFSIHERVQLMGGQINIESATGQGTRIVIELPQPQTGLSWSIR
jgi:PAS domain S-box-containing protein